jgi:hypothetical protein
MSYNSKINKDGTYRAFYGWTIISRATNDFKFIENYISKNRTLSHYFSALPSSSYHMTIYNIWCNGRTLLKHQHSVLAATVKPEEYAILNQDASKIGTFFNPNNCIDGLLYKLYFEARDRWKSITLKVKKVHYNGNTLRLSVKSTKELKKMNAYREVISRTCEQEDGMGRYHLTLAYKYRDIEDTAGIEYEVGILNMLLEGQTLRLGSPQVCSFTDMTTFRPI